MREQSLHRLLWAVLVAGVVTGAALLARFHGLEPRGTDDQYYFAQARSLLVDRDLDLRNELGELTPRPENVHTSTAVPWDAPTATGKVGCKYGIGAPLLQLPFVGLGILAGAMLGRPDGAAAGYEPAAYLAWTVGNVIWALLAVLFVERWLRGALGVAPVSALLGAAAALCGGPLLYHAIGDPYMAHAPSTATLALLVWLVGAGAGHAANVGSMRCLAIGAVFGLAVAARLSNLAFAALLLPLVWPVGAPAVRRALALTGGAVIGFLPQLLAWRTIYGAFFVRPYPHETFDFLQPHVWGNLFSARAGLFVWAPVWLVGLALAARLGRRLGFLWLASLGLVVLNVSWWCWWWGDTYGGRAYAPLFPLVAAGLAFGLLQPRLRSWLFAAMVLGTLWTGGMIARMELMLPAERAQGMLLPGRR